MQSVIRTSMVTVGLGAMVLLVFWRLVTDQQQQTIDELRRMQQETEARLAARERMLERLGRTRRVALVHILDQAGSVVGDVERTELRLIELDDDGAELARQHFTIPGDVLMVDAWTVKFGFEQVAAGHPLAGRTLMLLRRVYSDRMRPIDGYPIDTPGAVPPAYAVSHFGRFQQRIWSHFWELTADPELARSMGVRVAQGESVYKPVRAGQVYQLELDAAGGLSLVPLDPGSVEIVPG